MPHYRLMFPADLMIENTPTAQYESDEILEVGDVIEHGGKRWRVSKEPTEQPGYGETADLMVWPVE
jgi:hypothetical protein